MTGRQDNRSNVIKFNSATPGQNLTYINNPGDREKLQKEKNILKDKIYDRNVAFHNYIGTLLGYQSYADAARKNPGIGNTEKDTVKRDKVYNLYETYLDPVGNGTIDIDNPASVTTQPTDYTGNYQSIKDGLNELYGTGRIPMGNILDRDTKKVIEKTEDLAMQKKKIDDLKSHLTKNPTALHTFVDNVVDRWRNQKKQF